jgi:hypothetical protein
MCFEYVYENRTMTPVEIVLRREWRGMKENDLGDDSKIRCKPICRCHSEHPCTTNICDKNATDKQKEKPQAERIDMLKVYLKKKKENDCYE